MKRKLFEKKINISIAISLIGIITVIIFTVWLFYSSLNNFSRILEDHSINQELNSYFYKFQSAFENYAWHRDDPDCKSSYVLAREELDAIIRELPIEYTVIGRERYLKTMSVIHGYEGYLERCEKVLTIPLDNPEFIDNIYLCYETASYIQIYIDRLTDITLKNGDSLYQHQLTLMQSLSYIWLILGFFLLIFLYFYGKSIIALEKQKQNFLLCTELQKKELIQIQTEQTLNEIQIRLLQSQINPHFLFNTLTLISGMAQIENAKNTKEMTKRLSNIFRYNLKSEESITSLFSEISIAKDYLYIQQCRFGKRIQLLWDIKTDPSETFLPTFTLQPLLENSIIHGIAPKEEGGVIRVRIFLKDGFNHLSIVDNGMGISKETLQAIQSTSQGQKKTLPGIGIANICSRFQMLFPHSTFKIHSKPNYGTIITIKWENTLNF